MEFIETSFNVLIASHDWLGRDFQKFGISQITQKKALCFYVFDY